MSDALDDTDLPLRAVAQGSQCRLIGGTVVRGHGLRDTFELDQHGALLQTQLVNLRGLAARQEATAVATECRAGELRVRGELVGVLYRAVCADPIGLWHGVLSF